MFPTEPIVVGYEVVDYTSSEGIGLVELCAVVTSHPAGTPKDFTISATTWDGLGTASTLMSILTRNYYAFNSARICTHTRVLYTRIYASVLFILVIYPSLHHLAAGDITHQFLVKVWCLTEETLEPATLCLS